MGKSKKKLKADQINILRKQYDAFLEEDKKRKERNECILEKLDQIRLSNTVTRYKSNIYLDHRVSFNCAAEAPTAYAHPQTNNAIKQPPSANSISKYKDALIPTEVDILPKTLDEKYLINEISKKYILIPKLGSFVSEDYIPRAIKQGNNNDNDWKSKYSILDKLKQNEKGEIGYSALNGCNENYVDHIPSREPKFAIDEKARDVAKDKEDMYSEQYVSKPQTNMAHPKDEGEAKRNYTTVDAKNEEIIATQRFDISPKLNSKMSNALKPDTGFDERNQNIHNDSKVATEGYRLQPDHSPAASEMITPEYTYPTHNGHEHESALFKNIDDQHNEPLYKDKHESEASEKVSGENINHVEVVNTMKAAVQEMANEKHNMGAPETLEYPTEDIYVQDFTPAKDIALADVVNIHPEGYVEQQAYVAPSDQYVSEPAADYEQVYQPGEQSVDGDQYVSEQPVSAEEVYLPGANQLQGNDHYVSEPISAEQVYMPGTGHSSGGDQQYVSEPTVIQQQVYVSGDTQKSGDQHGSEPAVADTEQKDYTIENDGLQITSEETHDLPIETVTSEIAEFEAEQSHMFYSEQANYEGYNQAAEGGEYNPENTGYDRALYYQPQDEYPIEINEHEETSQRYDPSYEQQYTGQGAELEYAEQQQYADQQQYGEHQQYDEQQYAEQQYGEQQQSDLGGTMYVYDQVPSETEPEKPIVEQVQQELDNEENIGNKTAAGDVVEGSTVYMQNPGDVAPNEPSAEQQSPEKVS